jgi:pimeloyl-ACP methyl ester carboxylesterase
VILVHGFGASARHWRHTIPALSDCADVVAVDLLGFGQSDKPRSRLSDEPELPGSVLYCFDLWAQQIVDLIVYLQEPSEACLHLVGNSIGAMVVLTAARILCGLGRPASQLVLIDCAQRTLDDRRLAEQPALAQQFRPVLKTLIRQRWLTAFLFRQLARPATIQRVLRQAYPSGAHVDQELIQLLYQPTQTPGASESFRGFVNLFNDHLAPDLLERLSQDHGDCPSEVRMIWGELDPWENPEEARAWTSRYRCIEELRIIPGVGHCPHDEAPDLVNQILQQWITDCPHTPSQRNH